MANPSTRVIVPKQPRPKADACLVWIYPPGDGMGRKFDLSQDLSIGRDDENTVVIDTDSVSRRHALVVSKGGKKVVRDLESTNGTFVNDAEVTELALRSGDLLRIGDAIFKFLDGSIEALYHEEIYRLTIVDALTGAHNKRYLLEHLEREIARCRRYDRPLAVLMCDIDHFKRINDVYGHLIGDQVLSELGRLIRTRIRQEELFARYGGEEFVLVIPEATREAAVKSAEAIRELTHAHNFAVEDTRVPVTLSIGVALLDSRMRDPFALLRAADENLYKAKTAGRNRVAD